MPFTTALVNAVTRAGITSHACSVLRACSPPFRSMSRIRSAKCCNRPERNLTCTSSSCESSSTRSLSSEHRAVSAAPRQRAVWSQSQDSDAHFSTSTVKGQDTVVTLECSIVGDVDRNEPALEDFAAASSCSYCFSTSACCAFSRSMPSSKRCRSSSFTSPSLGAGAPAGVASRGFCRVSTLSKSDDCITAAILLCSDFR